MGLVLDTSVLIAAERGTYDLESLILGAPSDETVFITTVTISELLHGVHRASGRTHQRRAAFVEAIIADLPAISFDYRCARHHAKLWSDLESKGQRIGAHDMIIASCCIAYGHRLATLNVGGFERVAALQLTEKTPN